MIRRLPWLEIALAIGAFAILIAIAFEREARKVEVVYDTYSTFDTRSGGYAAWYELLQRERRAPVQFERLPAFLDASVGTFIAANPLPFTTQVSVSEANAAALARWVRDGGRLILVGRGPLSDALGKQIELPAIERYPAPAKAQVAPELQHWGVRRLEPQNPERFRKQKKYTVLFADSAGAIVVRRAVERGELLAVVDEQMLSNGRIATADHARLAYALAQSRKGRSVAFDESIHGHLLAEHWWELVPRAFLVALGLTLAAVAIAALGAAIRLGPAIVPRKRREATSSEYIDALAALFERARATKRSVLDAYVSTRRAVARKLGLPDEASDAVLAAALSNEETRTKFAELARLASQKDLKESALLQGAALAYAVRKDVVRGGG